MTAKRYSTVSITLHWAMLALIVAVWALRYIHSPKGRAKMADLADRLDRNGAFEALKPR